MVNRSTLDVIGWDLTLISTLGSALTKDCTRPPFFTDRTISPTFWGCMSSKERAELKESLVWLANRVSMAERLDSFSSPAKCLKGVWNLQTGIRL